MRQKGFTLIEVLVVVVIVAVLVSLLWGPLTRTRQKIREAAAAQWEVQEPVLHGKVLDSPRPTVCAIGNAFERFLAIPYQSESDEGMQILLILPSSDYQYICFTDEDSDDLEDFPKRGDELWEVKVSKEGVAYEAIVLSTEEWRATKKAYEVALDLNQEKK